MLDSISCFPPFFGKENIAENLEQQASSLRVVIARTETGRVAQGQTAQYFQAAKMAPAPLSNKN